MKQFIDEKVAGKLSQYCVDYIYALNVLGIKNEEKSIIDIGCGYNSLGKVIKHFSLDKVKQYSLDIGFYDTDFLMKSAKNSNNGVFIAADARDIPYKDNTFDYVVAHYLPRLLEIENFSEDISAELYRICKKGGKIGVTSPVDIYMKYGKIIHRYDRFGHIAKEVMQKNVDINSWSCYRSFLWGDTEPLERSFNPDIEKFYVNEYYVFEKK